MQMKEPRSAEEMERHKETAAMLLALMDRPMTEDEKEFWREFEKDLEKNRS
jgi:hypothetical protein